MRVTPIRVLAYNHNGDGAAAEVTVTPTATDTTAPSLLLARFEELLGAADLERSAR